MLESNNISNIINEDFYLKSYKCTFNISELEALNGDIKKSLTVTPTKSEPIYYAFSGSNGLCRTREYGGLENDNLLQKIMALSNNDAKHTLEFFENNGFLFPVNLDTATAIDMNDMVEIINRVKATALLLNALETDILNYDAILHYTLFLLLGRQVQIRLSEKTAYTSSPSSLHNILSGISTPHNINHETVEIDDSDYYVIKDTVYPQSFNFSVDEYNDISNGETFIFNYPGIKNALYRQLTNAYLTSTQSSNQRRIIDFLFHFMHDVGVVKIVTFDGGIDFYKNETDINLDTHMQKSLISIAKITLSQEINYNISRMKPLYNPNKLEPMWKAPSLLVALYFSIFFMKPSTEIYKKCANPSCTKYFTVKTTNTRKKYCCDHCRGASNSRDHRKRNKNIK